MASLRIPIDKVITPTKKKLSTPQQATTAEKVASFLDKFDWTLGDTQSSYVPQEYIHPWDREGWGGDIAVNPGVVSPVTHETRPPIRIPVKTEVPRVRPGQRDYIYMPTRREERRNQLEEIQHYDDVMGKDWRESPLPRGSRREEGYKYQPTERETERKRSLRDELMSDMGNWR